MHSSVQRPRKLSIAANALLAFVIAIAGLCVAVQPAGAASGLRASTTTNEPTSTATARPTSDAKVTLGTVVRHQPDGGVVITHTRVATPADLAAANYPCCSAYLHLSGITATSHLTCGVFGITTVCETVFYRSYEGCYPYELGLVYSCEAGSFVFNSSFVACGSTCSLGGLRGSHTCETAGDRSAGYSVDITGCGDYRINPIPAPWLWRDARQWKRMKICVYTGIACGTYLFHVDLMHDGSVNLAPGG